MKNIYLLVGFLFMFFAALQTKAQKTTYLDSLHDFELILQGQADLIINAADENTRRTTCFGFIKNLVKALKIPGSYDYPFDSLKQISILKAPDNKFRIFVWNLRLDNESYRYYGCIQMNDKQKGLKLFPLFDNSPTIRNPQDTVLGSDSWWGALYYTILMNKYKGNTYYTLLGWDGNDKTSNKKVIDVLTFQEGVPVFGAPIFRFSKDSVAKRVVFEFSNDAVMILRYVGEKKIILYDHLIPPKPSATGIYKLYLPDGSYDYLNWQNGQWVKGEKVFDTITIKTDADDIEKRTKKLKTKKPPRYPVQPVPTDSTKSKSN